MLWEVLVNYYPFDSENHDLGIRISETAASVLYYDTVRELLEFADNGKVIYVETEDDLSELWDIIEDAWDDGDKTLAEVIKNIGKEIDVETDYGYLEDFISVGKTPASISGG